VLQKALTVPSRKRCAGAEKKINISTASGPRTAGGVSLAACVVLDGTTLPRGKISRVSRAMERNSQKTLDDFCELA
jgi:hypothetical protein